MLYANITNEKNDAWNVEGVLYVRMVYKNHFVDNVEVVRYVNMVKIKELASNVTVVVYVKAEIHNMTQDAKLSETVNTMGFVPIALRIYFQMIPKQ